VINFLSVVISVGNKDDDPDRKVVLTQDAQRFADQMSIQLFETSAKENKNVEEVRGWAILGP
jgi:Ras-related protein Rab-35